MASGSSDPLSDLPVHDEGNVCQLHPLSIVGEIKQPLGITLIPFCAPQEGNNQRATRPPALHCDEDKVKFESSWGWTSFPLWGRLG